MLSASGRGTRLALQVYPFEQSWLRLGMRGSLPVLVIAGSGRPGAAHDWERDQTATADRACEAQKATTTVVMLAGWMAIALAAPDRPRVVRSELPFQLPALSTVAAFGGSPNLAFNAATLAVRYRARRRQADQHTLLGVVQMVEIMKSAPRLRLEPARPLSFRTDG
jgi:hypothetical protein